MTRGTVVFHQRFTFQDGEQGQKLLIVLNTPAKNEPYVVCKTTSKSKFAITKEGCHSEKGIYHIKAKTYDFDLDTWIQLTPLTELTKEELLKAHLQDKVCHIKFNLRDDLMRAILNCIKQGDDFTQFQADLLFS